ncbi:AAA family ATPase [Stutzerimonas azotifigens]|uniref:AAA family ATPase n=1 Tax=Stutzerimonas azotifigens TaxID=291995 RepID=UPI000414E077|nr:AAA family ATPase [Stutzerimonas azotifigens]
MSELSADELYLEHFQFSHDPFAARVPGFKFYPAQRKPVLGQLHHLARYSQLLLVVTGPEGSGKTLLRQALVASTNKQSVQSVVVAAQSTSTPEHLLQQVAQALGVSVPGLEAVLAQVVQLGLTGQEIYLLVDDAERLSDSGLQLLLRLAEGSPEGRPHVFLFGQPALASRLEALAGDEERYHVIELQPYTLEETEGYLAARLEGAGRDVDCLSDEQVEEIHELSGGWPGPINEAARDVLIDSMHADRARGRKGAGRRIALPAWLPLKHLAAVGLVALVVIAALLMLGGDDEEIVEQDAVVSLPLPAGSPSSAEAPAIEFDGGDRPTPLPLAGDAQPVIREPLAAAAADDGDEVEQRLPEPSTAPRPVETAPAGEARTGAAPRPAPAVRPEEPVESTQPAPPARPAASTPPAAPASTTPRPAQEARAADGMAWYRAQPAGNYLVQVLGTSNEDRAKAIVREQGSGYRYYTKQHQGKPLYVVTYGNFTDRASAQKAVSALPAALQTGKPWVRSFGSIQQEAGTAR